MPIPPDYICYFLLYVVVSQHMIQMVLVQEDDEIQEHVVYYISRNLSDTELCYTHIENLALATIHAIQ